jgi:hypothetical protein
LTEPVFDVTITSVNKLKKRHKMEERRRHQRYDSSKRKFVAQQENREGVIGEVKDFSRSGISFDSKAELGKNKEIKLDLQLNGLEQKIPASVQILWSKNNPEGFTYGAKFTNISPESRFDIMDLLYQDWRKALNS